MSDEPKTIYVLRWALNSAKIIKVKALPLPADPNTMMVMSGRLRGQQFDRFYWEPTEAAAKATIKARITQYIEDNERRNAQLRKLDFDIPSAIVDGDTTDIRVVMA